MYLLKRIKQTAGTKQVKKIIILLSWEGQEKQLDIDLAFQSE